jgi:hypothetical protein
MGINWSAFWSAAAGKVFGALLLVFLATIGLGTDWWAKLMTHWFADPLGLSLQAVRVLAFVLAVAVLTILAWRPVMNSLFPRFTVSFERGRDINKGLTQYRKGTAQPLPNKATYVHVRVAAGNSAVKCSGAITKPAKTRR